MMICDTLQKTHDTLQDPKKRRVIVLLEKHVIMDALDGEWIEKDDIAVWKYPVVGDSPVLETVLYKHLCEKNLVKPGMVLVQGPYNLDEYSDASEVDTFLTSQALEKYLIFSDFCRKLGATEFYGRLFENEISDNNTHLGTKVGQKGVGSTNVKVDTGWEQKVRKEIEIMDDYEGSSEPNIEDARKLLTDKNLLLDSVFTFLLDARTGNKITNRKLSFSLSKESKRQLHVVSGIECPWVNIGTDYGIKLNQKSDLSVTLSVKFGKG